MVIVVITGGKFCNFPDLGKIGISRDRVFLSLTQKIWDVLPDDYKTIQNLDTFKIKIKNGNQKNFRVGSVKFTLIE